MKSGMATTITQSVPSTLCLTPCNEAERMNKKEKTVSERSNSAIPGTTTERERAIDLALQQIERRFGKGAIMKLGDASHIHVDVIPTGSIAVSYTHLTLPKKRIV